MHLMFDSRFCSSHQGVPWRESSTVIEQTGGLQSSRELHWSPRPAGPLLTLQAPVYCVSSIVKEETLRLFNCFNMYSTVVVCKELSHLEQSDSE